MRASGCAPKSSSATCSRTAIGPSSFTDPVQPCGPFFVLLGSYSLCCRCAALQSTTCIVDLFLVDAFKHLDPHGVVGIYLDDLQIHQESSLGQSFNDGFEMLPSTLPTWSSTSDSHIADPHDFRPQPVNPGSCACPPISCWYGAARWRRIAGQDYWHLCSYACPSRDGFVLALENYGSAMRLLRRPRRCGMMENKAAGHAEDERLAAGRNYLLCLVDRILGCLFLAVAVGISPGQKHRTDYSSIIACWIRQKYYLGW